MEYGLKVDGSSLEVDLTTLYSNGVYSIGINSHFLKFPISTQIAKFEIKSRSKEGLVLNVKISIIFKLGSANLQVDIIKQLFDIYTKTNFNWNDFIIKQVSQNTRDILSLYSATDIILQRETIIKSLINIVSKELSTQGYLLVDLNIVDVEPDSIFINSYIETERISQKSQESIHLLRNSQIQAATNMTLAEMEKDIIYYEAQRKRDLNLSINGVDNKAQGDKIFTLFNNLLTIKNKFKLVNGNVKTANSELLQYYWIKIMQNRGNILNKSNSIFPENLKEF
jgi:hypothetical protein